MNSDSTITSYVAGFILSVLLTVAAYLTVEVHVLTHAEFFSPPTIISVIVALGIVQFFVQLFFFLHLGKKSTSRSQTVVFLFALLVVSILVGGSLWIMYNLNYNMTPIDVNAYMNSQDSL